jgi:hypothetical protein
LRLCQPGYEGNRFQSGLFGSRADLTKSRNSIPVVAASRLQARGGNVEGQVLLGDVVATLPGADAGLATLALGAFTKKRLQSRG